jgi:hypothetical protein
LIAVLSVLPKQQSRLYKKNRQQRSFQRYWCRTH